MMYFQRHLGASAGNKAAEAEQYASVITLAECSQESQCEAASRAFCSASRNRNFKC